MKASVAEAAKIVAVEALSQKFIDFLNPLSADLFLNALADTAAAVIHEAGDPETVRNQFVAALDQSLDMLTYMPQDLRR